MTAEELEDFLSDAIFLTADEEHYVDLETEVERVDTFEQAGVMTSNRGLVLSFEDGSEFQITIVRSLPPCER